MAIFVLPNGQESEVNQVLCHEDERDVDDLHGDEEEGDEKETTPQDAENRLTNYIIIAGRQL